MNFLSRLFLACLSSPIAHNVRNFESAYGISLSDNESYVRIVTSFVQRIETNEQSVMIDSDFFCQKEKTLTPEFLNLTF